MQNIFASPYKNLKTELIFFIKNIYVNEPSNKKNTAKNIITLDMVLNFATAFKIFPRVS